MKTKKKRRLSKLATDKSMLEEGVSFINKGILIGNPALDYLKDFCFLSDYESQPIQETLKSLKIDLNTLDVSCYFLVQGLELIIKGLILCFGELPHENHSIKANVRILSNIYEHRVNELYRIESTFEILTDNRFTGSISTWQISGRYEKLEPNLKDLDTTITIFNDFSKFVRQYQLTEVLELKEYVFFN